MQVDDVNLGQTWGTSEAAECLGMSVKTLRYWDEKGWLKACGLTVIRTPTGYRKFLPSEVERLSLQIKRQEIKIEDGQVRFVNQQGQGNG